MSYDLSKALVESIAERPDAARPSEAGAAGVPSIHPHGVPVTEANPHDPRPLDWDQAVDAAAARLEESWVRPDETGRMLSSGMADEFAATLCAFGMVAEEVVHMQVHSDRARGDAEGPSVNSQGKASG